jgi:hypothetical protein
VEKQLEKGPDMDQTSIFDLKPDVDPNHVCPTCSGTGQLTNAQYKDLIGNYSGAVGANHPETSRRAARRPSNTVRFGTQRYKALTVLLSGPKTAAEVADRLDISRNQTATRLGECRDRHLVEYVRDDEGNFVTRPTGPTDEGIVQRITALGILAQKEACQK